MKAFHLIFNNFNFWSRFANCLKEKRINIKEENKETTENERKKERRIKKGERQWRQTKRNERNRRKRSKAKKWKEQKDRRRTELHREYSQNLDKKKRNKENEKTSKQRKKRKQIGKEKRLTSWEGNGGKIFPGQCPQSGQENVFAIEMAFGTSERYSSIDLEPWPTSSKSIKKAKQKVLGRSWKTKKKNQNKKKKCFRFFLSFRKNCFQISFFFFWISENNGLSDFPVSIFFSSFSFWKSYFVVVIRWFGQYKQKTIQLVSFLFLDVHQNIL